MINPVYRIVLTENCNLSCPHCFNSQDRECGVMDADILIRFINENSTKLNSSTIKIMGGEPTLHPRVVDIITEASKYFFKVELFTNGTNMERIVNNSILTKRNFQGILNYTINGFTFNINKFSTYKDYINFIVLHFVVPLNNPEKMVKKLEKCMELSPQVYFLISPDTQVDLFNDSELNSYRLVWVETVSKIIPQLSDRNLPYGFDHKFPICFYTQEMIDVFHKFNVDTIHQQTTTCCGDQQIGLIDYKFDIYYCNQTKIKLGTLLDIDGNPITLEELTDLIQSGSKIKTEQIKKKSDKCMECQALPSCKVGCYYNILKGRQTDE